MRHHRDDGRGRVGPIRDRSPAERGRLLTDGGGDDGQTDEGPGEADERPEDEQDERPGDEQDERPGDEDERPGESVEESTDGDAPDRPDPEGSNVEITDEAEPADPRWERPDLDDIPEFEIRAEGPVTKDPGGGGGRTGPGDPDGDSAGPGTGRPNTARSPDATRISAESTEAYLVALELCARLPDDVRLPEEAAELVPAAVEAELEQDIQQFAAAEFGTEQPHVDTLTFEEVDGEIWLRLRIGLPSSDFDDLDPDAIRSFALEQLEGVF